MLNKFTDYCLGLKQHLIDNMSEFSRDTVPYLHTTQSVRPLSFSRKVKHTWRGELSLGAQHCLYCSF